MLKRVGQQLFFFLIACVASAFIIFVGFRAYYSADKLTGALTQSYSGKSFQVLAGQTTPEGTTMVVEGLNPEGFSFINKAFLSIDTKFYDELVLSFSKKNPHQSLLLAVRNSLSEKPLEQMLLYTEKQSESLQLSRFNLQELTAPGSLITDVGLLTDNLIEPYQIQSVSFVPKKITNVLFLQLLISDFDVEKEWQNSSINTHKHPQTIFMSPKLLVLCYFVVVFLVFVSLLWFFKHSLRSAWWVVLLAAWMVLDGRYLFEKYLKTKNSYDTYAHLSHAEKNLKISPRAATLANTIRSALPDNGDRHNIRIDFGWTYSEWVISANRYLSGKLNYFLLPYETTINPYEIPEESWHAGGFYYVDIRPDRLSYDKSSRILTTAKGHTIKASLLIADDTLSLYHVIGSGVNNVGKERL